MPCPPPPYYSLYIKSPPPQEYAAVGVLAERGEKTCFLVIKVDRISAGLRFGPPRGTAQARSDIAFACLRRGFQHIPEPVSAEGGHFFSPKSCFFHFSSFRSIYVLLTLG